MADSLSNNSVTVILAGLAALISIVKIIFSWRRNKNKKEK